MVSELTFVVSGAAHCSLVMVIALRCLVLVSEAWFCSTAISKLAAPVMFSCSASACWLVVVLALKIQAAEGPRVAVLSLIFQCVSVLVRRRWLGDVQIRYTFYPVI